MKRGHSEDDLAIQVASALRVLLPPHVVWFHCPNGGKRDAREGARFKAMGVLAGVPDLFFLWKDDHNEQQIAFIELKVGKNGPTDAQLAFADRARHCDAAFAICRSVDSVIDQLRQWGISIRGRIAA